MKKLPIWHSFSKKKVNLNFICQLIFTGDIAIALTDNKGQDVPFQTTNEAKTNSFDVRFEPKTPGNYKANVYFGEQEIPLSPFNVKVESTVKAPDASKVRVYGDGVKPVGVIASMPVSFTVDASEAGQGDVDVVIQVCNATWHFDVVIQVCNATWHFDVVIQVCNATWHFELLRLVEIPSRK